MPASIAFYCELLGFEIVSTSNPDGPFGWAWLRLNDAELMLNTMYDEDDERPPEPDSRRVAAHRDTCLYFGCRDVDAAYEYLRTHGMNVEKPVVQSYGMKQLYLTDPDGYGICFQWRAS
ncbi:MAG TPA: VOC family protein [Blastocatellia bacterium]|nr:VOC family protein [Blastocatellia bacterium]